MSRNFSISHTMRKHAINRALLRHKQILTFSDIKNMENMIWEGDATWVADLVGLRSYYFVEYKNITWKVIFDLNYDCIVTFLQYIRAGNAVAALNPKYVRKLVDITTNSILGINNGELI